MNILAQDQAQDQDQDQDQDQALLNLELYLATPEVLPTLPAAKLPPPPPQPTTALKPTKLDPKEAIFDTGKSKKRYGESVTLDEKELEKRPKLTQVVLKPSENIFTIFFSNNKNMIQIPSIKITKEIETKFLYFFRDCISVFNDGKISLNEVFDKAFNKAITFLNVIINMNIKPMVLTIGTNDGIVTDTSCLHITYDFFGSNDTLFLYRSLKMTNIDTFDKQVISAIKNSIAANAFIFSKNIKFLANFAEADAVKAKHDLNTALENITKAKSEFNTAQENITKAKDYLKTVDENARKAMYKSGFDIAKVMMAQKNVINAQENVITAQEKLAAAQENVTTAHQKLSTAQADATLTKEKAINAAKNATKKTKDALDAEMITKDKEKINLSKSQRWNIFKI